MAETYLGVIVATTTKNNADTAAPFAINGYGSKISIQPDTACYVRVGSSSSLTVTTANGVKVEANALFQTSIPRAATAGYVAVLAVSGTTNAKVFEREGDEG